MVRVIRLALGIIVALQSVKTYAAHFEYRETVIKEGDRARTIGTVAIKCGKQAKEYLPVLTIVSNGEFRSMEARGLAIAERLNNVGDVFMGDNTLVCREKRGEVYISTRKPKKGSPPILKVTRADVDAYSEQSARKITKSELGKYWAALLDDYCAVFLCKRMPRYLTHTKTGKMLKLVYINAKLMTMVEGEKEITSAILHDVLDTLSGDQLLRLEILATTVGEDFEAKR